MVGNAVLLVEEGKSLKGSEKDTGGGRRALGHGAHRGRRLSHRVPVADSAARDTGPQCEGLLMLWGGVPTVSHHLVGTNHHILQPEDQAQLTAFICTVHTLKAFS